MYYMLIDGHVLSEYISVPKWEELKPPLVIGSQ